MAGLPRSEISFRRSGSSGLVWDDKLLSGELNPTKPKDDEEQEQDKEQQQQQKHRSAEPKPYRTVDVAPTIDPPSPRVSGCCGGMFGGGGGGGGKSAKHNNTLHHRNKRANRKS